MLCGEWTGLDEQPLFDCLIFVVKSSIWVNQTLDWVPAFLQTCLNMDSKLDVVEEIEGPPVMTLDPIF
jgi:hypothetical protein